MPPYGPTPQSGTVDRDLAEQAKERANRESTKPWDPVSLLCDVCNRPYFGEDPNPNDFVREDDDGTYGNDYAAFQTSPPAILDRDPDNPWDLICVRPKAIETDDGTQLQVEYYRHDFDSEPFQLWHKHFREAKKNERRAEENRGLSDYAGGGA